MIVIASPSLQLRHYWQCWLSDKYQVQTVVNTNMLEFMLGKAQAGVVLLDLALPGLAGSTGVSNLRRLNPSLPIIALSAFPSPEEELELLKAGAQGYCSHTISAELLEKAVERVQQGEIWLARKLIPRLIEEISVLNRQDTENSHSDTSTHLAALTPREQEIAMLIGQGANNKIIARRLNITERTVKSHLSQIFRKLGILSRLQLALLLNGNGNSPPRP